MPLSIPLLSVLFFISASSLASKVTLKNLKAFDIIESPIRANHIPLSVTFSALGRNFSFRLNPSVTPPQKTEVILFQGQNVFQSHQVDLPNEFHGYLNDESSSRVSLLIGSRGEFYATVSTAKEVYMFEPLSYFEQWSHSQKVLAYRLSDVILPNMSLSYSNFPDVNKPKYLSSSSSRQKRGLPSEKRFCGLHFIADYSFFAHVGAFDYAKTVDIIVKTLNRVNEIFMSTEFFDIENGNVSKSGYGFYIKGISIETNAGSVPQEAFSAKALLSKFSRRSFATACLHHFLTFSKNQFGVLGMSWMASPALHHLGGICSSSNYVDDSKEGSIMLAPNTGFTSYCDSDGAQVLSSVAELVTAHELGHSWGAPHDPDTPECNPRAEEGGRYLMYTFAVPGYSPNNYRFSPCSRRAISRCLASKASLCFEDTNFAHGPLSQCGNSRVDAGEQCDPGRRTTTASSSSTNNTKDRCCTRTCRLAPGAKCSPLNHQCCTESCQLAKKGSLCAEPDQTASPCLSPGHCDGKSPNCPGPVPITEPGPRCHEHGYCVNGVCTPFCSGLGLRTCICNNAEDSCLICCSFEVELTNGERRSMCQPIVSMSSEVNQSTRDITPLNTSTWCLYRFSVSPNATSNASNSEYFFVADKDVNLPPEYRVVSVANSSAYVLMHLENNRPCAVGFCRQGVCVESRVRRVSRLWPLYLTTSTWSRILWDNIVSVIVALTFVVWVPLSCIVRHYDKKLREARVMAAQAGTPASGQAATHTDQVFVKKRRCATANQRI
uniref:ADAM 17 n=1 Tax=Mesocestoides corti TaxID=53468 RepID=A0A5K3F9A9_MESCO